MPSWIPLRINETTSKTEYYEESSENWNELSRLNRNYNVHTVDGSSYDICPDDQVLLVSYTITGTVAIRIPSEEIYEGRTIIVKDSGFNADVFNITITPDSGTIEGLPAWIIDTKRTNLVLVCDGTNWFII